MIRKHITFPSPFVWEAWLQGRNLKQPNTQYLKAFFFFDKQPGKESMIKRRHIGEAERWAQLDTEGGRPGRRVWMIFGFGEIFGSSSSSMSLSHTCTTTLGVDSVPAWSSYFSPEKREERGVRNRFFGEVGLGSEKKNLQSQETWDLTQGSLGALENGMRSISHGIPDWPPINYNTERATQPLAAAGPQLQGSTWQDLPEDCGEDWMGLAVSYQFLFHFPALLLIAV